MAFKLVFLNINFNLHVHRHMNYVFVYSTYTALYNKFSRNGDVIKYCSIFLKAKKVPSQMSGALKCSLLCSQT